MIKKIQIELTIFTFLLIGVFLTYNIDKSIYGYFSQLNYGPRATYLKDFFVKITELGDSFWYFLICFLIFLVSFLAKKAGLLSLKNYSYFKSFSVFSFVYLLLVGAITQTIKHVVGRPRPNYTGSDGGYEFNFFTTDSAFHSFPSGHSSTIMAVTLIASLTLPRLKIFFYIFGLLIALSRVVVGAHFITDVIAGSLVAIIVYKVLDFLIKEKYPKIYWNNFEVQNTSFLTKITVVFVVFAVFLTVGPNIDIFLSSLFYYENNQFMIQNYYFVSIIFRKILLPLLLIYIFVLPFLGKFLPLQNIFFGYKFSFKEIVFIWLSGITTLVLFVNILLKDMWGRTRPNDILEFGGVGSFMPWYKFGGLCNSNCSFVSGDASVGFMLVVFYFIIKKDIYCYLALYLGAAIGFVRIGAGGHFFSDIVFSQIVVTLLLAASFILYKRVYGK